MWGKGDRFRKGVLGPGEKTGRISLYRTNHFKTKPLAYEVLP